MNRQGIKHFGKNAYAVWRGFVWFLRWVSIFLFGVLFFVGLYFKLPPKALACIAIIPLVGIFVPKKIQPWVWGGLTVLLLSVWGWVHLPEQGSRQWRPYQYDGELAKIERVHLPDGIENAADRYEQVFDTYGEAIFFFAFNDEHMRQSTLAGPWSPEAYPALSAWISGFDSAIDQLVEASNMNPCHFAIPVDLASMKPQLLRINQFKGWTQLLIRSANRDLSTGRGRHALEKLMTIPRMAQHLYQQQTLFDQAGAFHMELMGTRALEVFIIDHCDDPDILAQIEQAFGQLDPHWAGNWPDILLREKLTAKNLAGLMYEINDSGSVRISHNAMMALQAGLGYRPQRLFLNQPIMNRLAVIGLWMALPSNPQRLAAVIDERFDHYSLLVQKGQQLPRYSLKYVWVKGLNAQSVIDWLAMQQVGYYWALDGQFQRHLAIVNQIRIFAALKRYYLQHQRWPQRLEELDIDNAGDVLTDPLCGKPFVYELTGQQFRLYSRGVNGADDDGVNVPKENKDDILLWPRNQFDNNGDIGKIDLTK
jgi:hypothetical protein